MRVHPLTTARIARGWSQAQLAEIVGVSTRTIARWEQGQTFPYMVYREQLCRLFASDAIALELLPENSEGEPAEEEQHISASGTSSTLQTLDPMAPRSTDDNLVAREGQLNCLKQELLSPTGQNTIALHGLPGVGKTALVRALIADAQIQAHFADGIFWAELGPHHDARQTVKRWSVLLNIEATEDNSPDHWSERGKLMRATVGMRRMLFVIDDAWSIETARALQVGGPHCTYILTTRLPQVAFAFSAHKTFRLAELTEEDGLALLTRFAHGVVEKDPQTARMLVRMVGGLPLGLNLLGKHLAILAHTGHPRRLENAISLLAIPEHRLQVSIASPLPDRPLGLAWQHQLSLQAAITLSFDLLSAREKAALSALTCFPVKPNSFSEEAAIAVTGESAECLDVLWDAGLLESNAAGRYMLHQTIADYARSTGFDQAAWCRFGNWIAELLHDRTDDTVLIQEWENVEAYLQKCLNGSEAEDDVARQMRMCLQSFLQTHAHLPRARHWLRWEISP
jgi:transcriptional regulator with XRE-family HTH domain